MKKEIDLQQNSPLSALVQVQGKGKQVKAKAGNATLKFSDIIKNLPLREPSISAQTVGASPVRLRSDMSLQAGSEATRQNMLPGAALPSKVGTEGGLQFAIEDNITRDVITQESEEDEQTDNVDRDLNEPSQPEQMSALRTAMVAQEVQMALSQAMPVMQAKPMVEAIKSSRNEPALGADTTKDMPQIPLDDHATKPWSQDPLSHRDAAEGKPLPDSRSHPHAVTSDQSVEFVEPDENSTEKEVKIESSFAILPQDKTANTSAQAEQKVTFTVTKIETVLLPAAAPANQPVVAEVLQKPLEASALASASLPISTSPNTNIVRTIHIQLQPDNLGELKVSMHLKGQELRLSVEVYTLEAHAALQRDKTILREVLEKAGYDIAEQSVVVTLRLESQVAQQTTPSNDNLSFSRGQGNEQGFRGASDGEQQRQASRQPGKDQHDAHSRHNQPEASLGKSASGIYI